MQQISELSRLVEQYQEVTDNPMSEIPTKNKTEENEDGMWTLSWSSLPREKAASWARKAKINRSFEKEFLSGIVSFLIADHKKTLI